MERQNEPDLQASKYRLDKICDNQHRRPCTETGAFTTSKEADFATLKFMQKMDDLVTLLGLLGLNSAFVGTYVQQDATQEQDSTSVLSPKSPTMQIIN